MVHLDNSDSYMMRNGIVQLLGQLVLKAFDPQLTEQIAIDQFKSGKANAAADHKQHAEVKQAPAKAKRNAKGKNKKKKKATGSDSEEEEEEEEEEDDEDFKAANHKADEKKAVAAPAAGNNASAELSRSMREQREQLYQILIDRVLDVSSYTRSKVLQTWIELAKYGCVVLCGVVWCLVGCLTHGFVCCVTQRQNHSFEASAGSGEFGGRSFGRQNRNCAQKCHHFTAHSACNEPVRPDPQFGRLQTQAANGRRAV